MCNEKNEETEERQRERRMNPEDEDDFMFSSLNIIYIIIISEYPVMELKFS